MVTQLDTIKYYINNNQEIKYIELVSKYTEINYDKLVDYTLDLYNSYIRQGINKYDSKIGCLNNVTNHACELSDMLLKFDNKEEESDE